MEEKMILRELSKAYAELAASDVNGERRQRMRNINSLRPDRPVVWLEELPWHEMDIDNELVLRCNEKMARRIEFYLRTRLYRWKYIQADMVLEPFFPIEKSCHTTGIGIEIRDETRAVDVGNNIISHQYIDQLKTELSLERLHHPVITADAEQDRKNVEQASELLGDVLPVKLRGKNVHICPWDDISMLRGVEHLLIDLVERPDFMHRTMEIFCDIALSEMEQMEALGLLDYDIADLHCTPPYVDDLPAKDFDRKKIRLKDVWFRSMAQPFSAVSKSMHNEYDIEHIRPLAERCGLSYYGCCEPLHDRIANLRSIKNLRKIGVSSWADVRKSAEEIGADYVFSRKPNPAHVAGAFNEDTVRNEIEQTILACKANNCQFEYILKDISTVSYKPENLMRWNECVQKTIDKYY